MAAKVAQTVAKPMLTPHKCKRVRDDYLTLPIHNISLAHTFTMENNGHSETAPSIRTHVCTFHWGSPTSKGSEHMIDGHRFDVEMHIVHKNRKYRTMEKASKLHDGLLVVGVLFKKVKDANIRFKLLDNIFNSLPSVKTYKDSVHVKYPLKIAGLLGNVDTNVFFSYRGSLTTPPCYQSVRWYVFRDAVPITEKQLNNFFEIMDVHGEPLLNNFRLPQSKGGRTVRYHSRKSTKQ
ncbi:carbonic anhydrase 15-like [Glossina fuscipes]|uniref:Carbonic anhydrase n=1 Tax=Glossina fuscipes TaxID=7396 RepID=A0A8U0WII9_9MUSC|nr:carbonic anhydrase 15-like [Glossina fuscipes]